MLISAYDSCLGTDSCLRNIKINQKLNRHFSRLRKLFDCSEDFLFCSKRILDFELRRIEFICWAQHKIFRRLSTPFVWNIIGE